MPGRAEHLTKSEVKMAQRWFPSSFLGKQSPLGCHCAAEPHFAWSWGGGLVACSLQPAAGIGASEAYVLSHSHALRLRLQTIGESSLTSLIKPLHLYSRKLKRIVLVYISHGQTVNGFIDKKTSGL